MMMPKQSPTPTLTGNDALWDTPSSEEVFSGAPPGNTIQFSAWPTDPIAENQVQFRTLAQEWKAATSGLPRVIDKVMHKSYKRIISWGMHAIPHILADLQNEDEPAHWFEALSEITGANPVPEQDRGNMVKMAEAWIRWGQNRNLI